ncbi:hypothetical protein OC842_005246 [Tilletia horrida]|uniref:Uncharacterized protein n=1 Tax=Tilletia horrida TaxID=155126 RepID=A0AAN6JJ85_9BASI|nr:hypothetical protein OC842_005246 [Tilletia horrida]
MSSSASTPTAAAAGGGSGMRRPSNTRHGSSINAGSFLSSLRALSFDEIQDLPASIAAKHAAVESNISRLAVQHIDGVLEARDAAASLPSLRASLRAKLQQIQTQAAPELAAAVSTLPAHAQPAVLKYQRSDTLAKTIADEEALSLLLHAPVTVKNLVTAATRAGALLGPTNSEARRAREDSSLPEDGVLDPSLESGSQAASAALSITMRLFALAAEGSVLLSSSSSSSSSVPTLSYFRRAGADAAPDAIHAAARSLHSIAMESLMHLHSLKLFLIRRTLHDVHLKLADAIRVVTMIRHMRSLKPQVAASAHKGTPPQSSSACPLLGSAEAPPSSSSSPGQQDESALDELGLSEFQLMLAFFQARASVLRTVLASPPPTQQVSLPPDAQDAFSELLSRAKSGPTMWTLAAWKDQVGRTLTIAKAVFEGSTQDSAAGSAGYQDGKETLPLLRSSFASFAVRLLADMLEVEGEGNAGQDEGTTVRLRAQGEHSNTSRESRKRQEKIAMALHLYTYSVS